MSEKQFRELGGMLGFLIGALLVIAVCQVVQCIEVVGL